MKRSLLILFKYVLPLGIVVWLLRGAVQDASFERLWTGEKNWPLLLAATFLAFAAVITTFVRWYLLVRAVNLPFRLRDAFRLGFLGYMFNFVAPGSVGGDLFKAVFIAREHPNRKTSAVASVIVDRLIGLYALFLVATGGFLLTDIGRQASALDEFKVTSRAALICTIVGTLGGLLMLIPALTDNKFALKIERKPKIGPLVLQLHTAIRTYRRKVGVLLLAVVMSVMVHSLFAVSFFLISQSLPGSGPSLEAHFVIAPLSMLVGILPVMANGLGVVEGAMKLLYQYIPSNVPVTEGLGLLVSLTYRVITVVIAGVGFVYYLLQRREVTELMHEAETAPPAPAEPELRLKTSRPVVAT